MKKYKCKRCGYETNYISHYKTHLTKKKPCKAIYADIDRGSILAQLKTPEGKNACKTLVVVPTTMTKEEAEGIEDKETFILQMHEDNVKLKNEVVALKNANAELTSKLQALQAAGGAASVTNNNTNNINITHIHINNYGKENTDYITDDFLVKAFNSSDEIEHTVPKLLKHIHFNPEHPENHNVKMPNKRDKHMLIRQDGQWNYVIRKEIIKNLVERGHTLIHENMEGVYPSIYSGKRRNVKVYMDEMANCNPKTRSLVDSYVEAMLLTTQHGVI